MKLAAIIQLARTLIEFCQWAFAALQQHLRQQRLDEIEDAHDDASTASTRAEKVAAAKRLESAIGLRPPGSPSKPRRE